MTESIGRPEPDEYAPYAGRYVELVEGNDAIRTLTDQIEKTVALLEPMSDEYAATFSYAPGKWTVKQIVGHMSDTERVFSHRVLHLARRDASPLPPFEQDDYVVHSSSNSRSFSSLLQELRAVRISSLALFHSLPEATWLFRGRVSDWNLTTRGLLFTLAGHELHHYRIFQKHYVSTDAVQGAHTKAIDPGFENHSRPAVG
jgi:hypothetical protein